LGLLGLDLHQAIFLLRLFDLLLYRLVHLVEHLLVQLKDFDLVARFLDSTGKFVNFEFKRFNADGILEDEL